MRINRSSLCRSRWIPAFVPFALVAGTLLACGAEPSGIPEVHQHSDSILGAVHFNVSCADEVSDDFDDAVAMLHHMQYEESRTAFEQIATEDPDCGMAHWGIAMTLFQPLWPSRPGADALQRGWNELSSARALGIGTDREDGLVTASEAFYREPESADWWTRISRWSEAMDRAHTARPDDVETAAFYALSQLAAGQTAPDRMDFHGRAASVLLGIYEREPTHPGAIHYTIHANDVDGRSAESIDVVRSYSEIAPSVPHALHMPTHIFVRLGLWPDVIEWNQRSSAAALDLPADDGISHHYPHAIDYLVYAHLQRGEDETARVLVEQLSGETEPFQGTFISAFHLAAVPARYAVERRNWEEALAIAPGSPTSVQWDRFWWAEAHSWFAKGLGAVHEDAREDAEHAETRLSELRDAARSAGEDGFATYIEIDRLVLASWRAYASDQSEQALTLAREAVALEATTQKHPITPGALYPSQEAVGDMLMELDLAEEALSAYEASLDSWPGRFNSLAGAARAAREAGLDVRAREHYEALLESAPNAGTNRPVILEAQEILAR